MIVKLSRTPQHFLSGTENEYKKTALAHIIPYRTSGFVPYRKWDKKSALDDIVGYPIIDIVFTLLLSL
jgi:hypothetical protein